MPELVTVASILAALDRIAPPHLALGNDPTGLLLGDPEAAVTKVLVGLDITHSLIEAARARQAGMLISHHPLIYHPLKSLRADHPHPGSVALACARRGIAVACAHTCWDIAPGGVNDVLAGLLGLTRTRPLQTTFTEKLVKITVYVPSPYRQAVLQAMAAAGAGAIGDYDRCAFWTAGTGTFRPLAGASPFIGEIGRPETVGEDRLEMIAPETGWQAIIRAIKAAHPYEEVAYDVYSLKNGGQAYGLGRIGELPEPLTPRDFLRLLRERLAFDAVRTAGPQKRPLRVIAVCGGAGAELMAEAQAAGADALVTSDVRHHEFVEAEARGFLLMDAGHAATEIPGTKELAVRLAERVPVPVEFV